MKKIKKKKGGGVGTCPLIPFKIFVDCATIGNYAKWNIQALCNI